MTVISGRPDARREGEVRSSSVGAMTSAMRAARASVGRTPRCLRLGVVCDGRVDLDFHVRDATEVTVGAHERNTLVVHETSLLEGERILSRTPAGWVLELFDGMRGRIARADGIHDVEALLARGERHVRLDDHARGKLELGGGVALLVSMVHAPPPPVRPALPPTVRGGLLAGIDWQFSAFVTTSFLAFLAGALVLEASDYPVSGAIATLPAEVARLIVEEPEPPPEPLADGAPEESVDDDALANADGHRTSPRDDSSRSRATPRRDAVASLQDVESARQAALLQIGALSRDLDRGALADLLTGGALLVDARAVLAEVEGASPRATAGGVGFRGADVAHASGDGLGALDIARHRGLTANVREGAEVAEVDIRRFVVPEVPRDIGGSGVFDMSVVTRQVRSRLRAIAACYEHELRNRPGLHGKVTMELTIEETGTVSGVTATENTTGVPALDMCIARPLSTLRFREGPEGGEVRVTYPFLFMPQG